jgi:hypothetical protein
MKTKMGIDKHLSRDDMILNSLYHWAITGVYTYGISYVVLIIADLMKG